MLRGGRVRLIRCESRIARGVVLLSLAAALVGCGAAPPSPPEAALSLSLAEENGTLVATLSGSALPRVRAILGARPEPTRRDALFAIGLRPPQPGAHFVPMIADLRWEGDAARLVAATSATPGRAYRAVFRGPQLDPALPDLTADYDAPAPAAPSPARVVAIYPTQRTLPANLLKFYVHFSEPMAEGHLFRFVRLTDAAGEPIDQAFREVELWSSDHRRVTLWINPGRTKRALGLSESLGPVLVPGREYRLEIRAGLPDQRGRPLAAGVSHRFRTTAPDREQPRIAAWEIVPPTGGREPLIVRFSEPLDHALAMRTLHVETAAGEPVAGEPSLDARAEEWRFTPAEAWRPGRYRLVAGGELEDLAGNSLYRAFETPADAGRHPLPTPPTYRREFAVAAR